MSNANPPGQPQTMPPTPNPTVATPLAKAHTAAACLSAALATGPTSIAELAIIPAAVAFLATPHKTYPIWIHAYRRPLGLALLLFSAWIAIGIAYSPDNAQAIDEFGVLRFFPIALLISPALHLSKAGRLRVIAALAIGVAIGQLIQLLHAWAALADGPALFDFDRAQNRISGYWDPAVAGTILTAALGLHLPAALMGTGKQRAIAITAAAATIAALLATGSRGGWIASAALTAITAAVAITRALKSGTHKRQTLTALAALALLTLAAGVAFRGTITARIDKARADLTAATEHDYSSADAARVAMALAAIDAFKAHPIRGVGTGNFGNHARAQAELRTQQNPQSSDTPAEPPPIHDHAHNTLLHTAATHGLVGVTLLLAVAAAAIRQSILWIRHAPTRATLGSYQAGPLFALIGLILITPFDTLHVSTSSAAITGVILALSINPPRRAHENEADASAP